MRLNILNYVTAQKHHLSCYRSHPCTDHGLRSFGNRVGGAKEELEQINTVF
jgi:hypothetical protein